MQEHPPSQGSASEEHGLAALIRARRQKLEHLLKLGIDPWGGRFDGRHSIASIRQRAEEIQIETEDGQRVSIPSEVTSSAEDFRTWLAERGAGQFIGPRVRAAGRIILLRDTGKLKFIDLQDETGRIQLFVGQSQVGPQNWELARCADLGDWLGVDGHLRRTKTGELTIFAEVLHFLGKALDPPPSKYHGIHDPELRHRMRYLDLAYNPGVRERFLRRTQVVQSIRRTLAERGFHEIEGPTLHTIAGGAAARPFTTHHNALGIDLFLRIALELHLKRLLVGGLERVFELGRVYRNEGISPRHNPEFTMLEIYEAFGDYQTMMDLTEALILDAVEALGLGRVLPWGEGQIRMEPPFERRSYDDLLSQLAQLDPRDVHGLTARARQAGLETEGKHPDVIKNELFETLVEPQLTGPIFVMDYPASICPLTKRKRGQPELAERFELFIQGMEIANAYTELNDPDLQAELFQTQLAGLPPEESMARMDHDFIRALRQGMPPAGGLGVGIDRLVMLLTNTTSIRDVILFPLLRPEAAEGERTRADEA